MLRPRPINRQGRPVRLSAGLVVLSVAILLLVAASASAKAPKGFFGVSAVQPTAADFSGMGDLGVGSFRVEFSWGAIQASQGGNYNFNGTDERVRLAAESGMEIVPILFGTPPFFTGDGEHIYGPKGDAQRSGWQDFVEAAMTRYRRGGEFWAANPQLDSRLAPTSMILWNEQNALSFWWPKANPKQYAKLLSDTREALDRVDRSLEIVTGGMFGFPQDKKKSINAKPYLKKLYKQRGAKNNIDGVSIHPYDGKLKGVKKQVNSARRVMNKAGDRKAGIVIGEFGWSSGGRKNNEFVKSKKGQAKLLKKAHNLFLNKRRKWKISSIYWFTYKDYDSGSFCLWCAKAGLVNQRGKLKPSGKAYKKLVRKST
jgi:hypothetical protein